MKMIARTIRERLEVKYTVLILTLFSLGIIIGGIVISLESLNFPAKMLILLFFFLAVGFGCWLTIRRLLAEPVQSLQKTAQSMARGDLSAMFKRTTDDEIGVLGETLNQSVSALGRILSGVGTGTGQTIDLVQKIDTRFKQFSEGADIESEAIFNIAGSLEQMNSASSEISKSTEGLAVSTEEKAASLEQMVASIGQVANSAQELSNTIDSTSASIEELSATIKEVANKAEELTAASEETLTAAEEIFSSIKEVEQSIKESATLSEKVKDDASTFGLGSVEKTVEGIQDIKSTFDKTANFIKKLGVRSDEIGKILNVIDEITDQTTLLALNAAVLAAQAGEHGKGFSVVADEIKDLAERTSFSTREIAELIQAVRQEVKDTTLAMDDGLRSVDNGLKVAKDSGDALKKIVESSKQSAEMSLSIERSTAEQAKATRLVSGSMERVKNMVSQVAKATMEQSKGAVLITRATERMRDVANHVKAATGEQLSNMKQVTESIELVSEKSRQIARAVQEQRSGSQQIFHAIETIKEIPDKNKKIIKDVNEALDTLLKNAESLTANFTTIRPSEHGTVHSDKSK